MDVFSCSYLWGFCIYLVLGLLRDRTASTYFLHLTFQVHTSEVFADFAKKKLTRWYSRVSQCVYILTMAFGDGLLLLLRLICGVLGRRDIVVLELHIL